MKILTPKSNLYIIGYWFFNYFKRYAVVGEFMLFATLSGWYIREDLYGTFLAPHSISLYNMVTQRAGDIGEHDVSWAMIFGFMAYVRLKMDSKYINLIAVALIGLFLIGLDEETWNLVYYINVVLLRQDILPNVFINPPPIDATVGWVAIYNLIFTKWALFLITFIALIVPLTVFLKKQKEGKAILWSYFDKRRLFIAIGIFFSYFIIWTVAFQFMTTVSFFGETIWYHSLFVNGLENLHWIIGSVTLMWAFKGEQSISWIRYKKSIIDWWTQ